MTDMRGYQITTTEDNTMLLVHVGCGKPVSPPYLTAGVQHIVDSIHTHSLQCRHHGKRRRSRT